MCVDISNCLVCNVPINQTRQLAMNLEDRILIAFAISVFGGALALAVVATVQVIASVIG